MTHMVPADLPMFIIGTSAYNAHVQNMVQALADTGALARYVTGGVDVFHGRVAAWMRQAVARRAPMVDRGLARRRIGAVPAEFVESHWAWEALRLAAGRLGRRQAEDWCWEHGEHALDRHCARLMEGARAEAFLGVEHGALFALRAARAALKPAVLAFLSPHHATRARWVDAEYDRAPELRSGASVRLQRLGVVRDARRDEEAATAQWIVANSSFTAESLIAGGVPATRVLTVPLAAPPPIPRAALPPAPAGVVRFVYAGPVSVRKGAHYLLDAWRHVAGPTTELHFYGAQTLPSRVVSGAIRARGGERVFFHGSVPGADLPAIYQQASALVLPTLCDGFGQVVADALACGLPVVTTTNAGAADIMRHGVSGLVIPPADAGALVAALQWCVHHPRALHAMRGEALDAAAAWSWTDYRAALVRVLSTALSTGGVEPAGPLHARVSMGHG
jgi:glycosyltransferase involved in cell wall biosynthesis